MALDEYIHFTLEPLCFPVSLSALIVFSSVAPFMTRPRDDLGVLLAIVRHALTDASNALLACESISIHWTGWMRHHIIQSVSAG
jgi:hypothetical protein